MVLLVPSSLAALTLRLRRYESADLVYMHVVGSHCILDQVIVEGKRVFVVIACARAVLAATAFFLYYCGCSPKVLLVGNLV